MQFAYTKQELKELQEFGRRPAPLHLHGDLLWTVSRTEDGFAREVLPPPLRAPKDPTVFVSVAHYPVTNFGVVYRESTVLLSARYRGEAGWYPLSVLVDDDVALTGGRDLGGWPKKMAQLDLRRDGDHVAGSAVRRGTEVLRIEGEFPREVPSEQVVWPDTEIREDQQGRPSFLTVVYTFKSTFTADVSRFAHLPRLIRNAHLFTPITGQRLGTATVSLVSSDADALGDVPVGSMIASGYGTFDGSALPLRVLRMVNPLTHLPYAIFAHDSITLMALYNSPAPAQQKLKDMDKAPAH